MENLNNNNGENIRKSFAVPSDVLEKSKYISKYFNRKTGNWDYNYGQHFNGSQRMETQSFSVRESGLQTSLADTIVNAKTTIADLVRRSDEEEIRREQEIREIKAIEQQEGLTKESRFKRHTVKEIKKKEGRILSNIDEIHQNTIKILNNY